MRLSFITPTAFIGEFGSQGDFILALSHLIDLNKENAYEKAIKATGLPVLCDNGLFENGKPEKIETLILKAIKLRSYAFFAPDVMFDKEATQIELDKTIKLRKELGLEKKIKIAAVVQASNEKDFWAQLKDFNNNPDVDLIGLSMGTVAQCSSLPIMEWSNDEGKSERVNGLKISKARTSLLDEMCNLKVKENIEWKECHLLGLGSGYRDVQLAKFACPWVVSNDSSCCFQAGKEGRVLTRGLDIPGGKVEAKVDFDLKVLSSKQKEDIQENINIIKYTIK